MHRHASREGEALRKAGGTGMQHLAAISRGESSCEGFQSSDDDDENVSRTAAINALRLLVATVVDEVGFAERHTRLLSAVTGTTRNTAPGW